MLQALKLPGLLSLLTSHFSPLTAQGSTLLPSTPTFEYPLASHRASAMVGRIIYVNPGESLFRDEMEAEAGLGEIWPLLSLSRGRVPLTVHLGTEVYGRFSLGDAASALISNDWQVNLVLTADFTKWRIGVETWHESSHLGDEYRERFDLARINWSRELAGVWLSRNAGALTMTLNGSYALTDRLGLERLGAGAGLDFQGRRSKLPGGGTARPVLGIWAEAQEYTDWDLSMSGRAGVRFGDGDGKRGFSLLLTFLDGRSPQKQLFQEKTRYFGMEVRFDL